MEHKECQWDEGGYVICLCPMLLLITARSLFYQHHDDPPRNVCSSSSATENTTEIDDDDTDVYIKRQPMYTVYWVPRNTYCTSLPSKRSFSRQPKLLNQHHWCRCPIFGSKCGSNLKSPSIIHKPIYFYWLCAFAVGKRLQEMPDF